MNHTNNDGNDHEQPLDEEERPLPSDRLPLATALRDGHRAFGGYRIRAERGLIEIEAGALSLVGPAGYHGAIVVFWPLDEDDTG